MKRPPITVTPAICVIIIAVCVTALELMALHKGVDGMMFTGVITALVGIAAAIIGVTLGDVFKR